MSDFSWAKAKRRLLAKAGLSLPLIVLSGCRIARAEVKPSAEPALNDPNANQVSDSEKTSAQDTTHSLDHESAAIPKWLRDAPLLRWASIPGTKYSDLNHSKSSIGYSGFRAAHAAWNGYACWRERSTLIGLCNGGHGDLANNQQDYLNLAQDHPQWREGWPGSEIAGLPSDSAFHYSPYSDAPLHGNVINNSIVYLPEEDGTLAGAAVHTYQNIEFLEDTQRVLIANTKGGLNWNVAKLPPTNYPEDRIDSNRIQTFNAIKQEWDPPQEWLPPWPNDGGSSTGGATCTNPITSDLYLIRGNRRTLWKLNRASGSWLGLRLSRPGRYCGMSIDIDRNLLLLAGSRKSGAGQFFRPKVVDLNTFKEINVDFTGLGPDVFDQQSPSVEYCHSIGKFVVLQNGENGAVASRVFTIDPVDSWKVSELASTNAAPPSIDTNPQNKARYLPKLKCIVYQNRHDENCKFIRLAL